MTLWLQTTELLGDYAYVGRTTDSLDTDLARIKKRHQRDGTEFLYVVAGNIIISNVPVQDNQRFMELKAWRKRFITEYMFAINRIRRSRAFGRLSRFTLKRSGEVGTSLWQLVQRVFETPQERRQRLQIEESMALLESVGITEREYLTEWEVHEYVNERNRAITKFEKTD